MVKILLTRLGENDGTNGVWLDLPVSSGDLSDAFSKINEAKGAEETEAMIWGVESDIKSLDAAISKNCNMEVDCVGKMNVIAEKTNALTETEREILTGEVEIHESALPYVDFNRVGAEFYANNSGTYTDNGYVVMREDSRLELEQDEPQKCVIKLGLAADFPDTIENPLVELSLPASEQRLEKVRKELDIESWNDCVILKSNCPICDLDDLIESKSDMVTLNRLASDIADISEHDGDLSTFLAALEAEAPDSIYAVREIVENLDNYELLPGRLSEPSDYAEYFLYESGRVDDFKEEVRDYVLLEEYGKDMMRTEGIRETAFGLVRRISEPFPEPEQSQGMQMGGME